MHSGRWHEHGDGVLVSLWANVIDGVQTLLAIASAVLWLVGEYWDSNGLHGLVDAQFTLSVCYIGALLAQLASSGIGKHRRQMLAFDAVTSLPIFYQSYQLGYYSHDSHGWNEFITDLHVPLQWLVVVRSLRIVRLFKRTTLRSGALIINSDIVRSVASLLFTVLCLIIVGGGLLQLIENASVDGSQLTVWDALYTVFGVITVIGWGTPPQTVLGQVVDTVILLGAIVVLPVQINNLVNAVSEHYKLGLAYTSRAPHVVMVVYPTMTPSDLASMLREFYSYHAGLSVYRCVLLGAGGESHRDTLLSYVAKSAYWSSVTYVVGSPSSIGSLQKVAVQHASAVFLLTSAWFVDPGQELADDEQSLFQALTIKQYCPSVPLIMSLNKPSSRAHVLWFELCQFPNVQAVCLNEIKLQLLATQAMAPGLLGLIANLLQFGGHTGTEPLKLWWQDGLTAHRYKHPFTAYKLLSTPLVLGTWPLSAAVPAERPIDRAVQRSWEVQYLTGFLQELRTCPLPRALSGLCFADVAAALYERLLVVLLAVGRRDPHSGKLRAMLNPGYGGRLTVEQGDLLCIMVQSAEHARAVSEVQWQRDTVRERWLQQSSELVSSASRVQFTSLGSPISAAVPMSSAVARHFSQPPPLSAEQPSKRAVVTGASKLHIASTVDLPAAATDRCIHSDRDRPHIVELVAPHSEETKNGAECGALPTLAAETPSRTGSTDQFSGHIVLCGFIDSRIISFIRRFRASDDRPLVLMLDNAVCYPLPAVTQHFITANFKNVYFVYAAHTFKARHQRARVYLSYSEPCFGHHHIDGSSKEGRRAVPSLRAKASCVSSRGGHRESEREVCMRPTLPIDEVGPHDRRMLDSLQQELHDRRLQQHSHDATSSGSSSSSSSVDLRPPRHCRLHADDEEPREIDAQTTVQYANWYRRACVHSADMVFILSSAYTAPPDSTSSNGGTALDDDITVHRSQLYLTSLFQYAQRATTDAVKDDQIRADQHALIMHAGINPWLHTSLDTYT